MTLEPRELADLYLNNYAKLNQYAARYVGAQDSEDIVQEAFLLAWKKINTCHTNPAGWLCRIVHNQAISHTRKKRVLSSDRLEELVADEPSNREELLERVNEASTQLLGDTTIVVLWAAGYTVRETASNIGKSIGYVSKMRNAVAKRARQL